ncbi:MAG TPA: beta-galactosidase trimerization domain-containing protein, partial [Candidatus Saccharimonadales bacterium]|nr:beta-galactosidase trimerization domain-containing protein [Candidatus Saccharimonadales bacterium]
DLYLALQHGNIPVDFIDEEDLGFSQLKSYRVIYLTEPNLPLEAGKALLRWVRSGGTLVRSPNSGEKDRYNEPAPLFSSILGVQENPRERTCFNSLKQLNESGRVESSNGRIAARGPRSNLLAYRGSVLAHFENGTPAVLRTGLGAGQVFHFSWFSGLSYAASSTTQKDKLPTGFSKEIRNLILLPTTTAEVECPVMVDREMVETPMLLTKTGAAITLLNWTGEKISRMTVTARVPFKPARVESVRKGPIKFHLRGKTATFEIELGAADIVLVKE